MSGGLRVVVNGESRDLDPGSTVADVVRLLTHRESGVAVARNGAVVPRSAWSTTAVEGADELEVLTAVQGG